MDQKFADALIATLRAQRDAALDEAARLNASLVVVAGERDAAKADRAAYQDRVRFQVSELRNAIHTFLSDSASLDSAEFVDGLIYDHLTGGLANQEA